MEIFSGIIEIQERAKNLLAEAQQVGDVEATHLALATIAALSKYDEALKARAKPDEDKPPTLELKDRILKNKDTGESVLVNQEQYIVLVVLEKCFGQLVGRTKLYQEFMKNGAAIVKSKRWTDDEIWLVATGQGMHGLGSKVQKAGCRIVVINNAVGLYKFGSNP